MQSFFAKFLIFNSQLIFIVSVSMYLCWTYWKKLNQEINDLEIPYQALGFFSVVFPHKEDASSIAKPRFRRLSWHGCISTGRGLVIPPVVVDDRSSLYHRWPSVRPGIIQYSITSLGRMEGWVGLAARGGTEICCC